MKPSDAIAWLEEAIGDGRDDAGRFLLRHYKALTKFQQAFENWRDSPDIMGTDLFDGMLEEFDRVQKVHEVKKNE